MANIFEKLGNGLKNLQEGITKLVTGTDQAGAVQNSKKELQNSTTKETTTAGTPKPTTQTITSQKTPVNQQFEYATDGSLKVNNKQEAQKFVDTAVTPQQYQTNKAENYAKESIQKAMNYSSEDFYNYSNGRDTKTQQQLQEQANYYKNEFDNINNSVAKLNADYQSGAINANDYKAQIDILNNRYNDASNGVNGLSEYQAQIYDHSQEIEDNNKRLSELHRIYEKTRDESALMEYRQLKERNDYLTKLSEDQLSYAHANYYEYLKANGTEQELADYTNLMASANDNFVDRALTSMALTMYSPMSSAWEMVGAVEDVVKDLSGKAIKAGAEAQKGSISLEQYNKFLDTAQKLIDYDPKQSESYAVNEYVRNIQQQIEFNTGDGAYNFLLKSVNSATENMALLALGMVTGVGTGLITATHFASGFSNDYYANLEKGWSPEISALNSGAKAFVEAWVEKQNMDNFISRFTPSAYEGIAMLTQNIMNQGLDEAQEELIGWIANGLIDYAVGDEFTNERGEKVDAFTFLKDAYFNKDSLNELGTAMGVAFVSSAIMGGGASIASYVDQSYSRGEMLQGKAFLEEKLNSGTLSRAEESACVFMLDELNTRLYDLEGSIASKVETAEDVRKAESARSLFTNIDDKVAKSLVPSFKEHVDFQLAVEDLQNTIQQTTQEYLEANNVVIKASDYLAMSSEERARVVEQANNIKNGLIYSSELAENQNGTYFLKDSTATIDGVDYFVPKGTKAINPNSKKGVGFALGHEATHYIKNYLNKESNGQIWGTLQDYLKSKYTEAEYKEIFNRKKALYENYSGQEQSNDYIEEEIIADLMGNLNDSKDIIGLINRYNENFGYRLYNDLKAKFSNNVETKAINAFLNGFRNAVQENQIENDIKYGRIDVNDLAVSGDIRYSISSMFQSIGMTIEKNENGTISVLNEGKKVDVVTKAMVKNSPLGRLLEQTAKNQFITEENAEAQMQMYADLCNIVKDVQDPDLVWAISSSLGFTQANVKDNENRNLDDSKRTKSSALTSNSDTQYSFTFDVTTICNKTQQLIDVMSQTMVEMGRGLTEDEIIKVVYDTLANHKDANGNLDVNVPCPVCYVFSRWVGVGGLLDNINNYQNEYGSKPTEQIRSDFNELNKKVLAIMEERGVEGTKARDILSAELRDKFYEIVEAEYSNMVKKKNELKNEETRAKILNEEMNQASRKELDKLNEQMKIMDRWSWIKDVRLGANYKAVPQHILFDMNRGEEFANSYPTAWKYRTTRGPAMGKAITPYTSEVLGQTIFGIASPTAMDKLGNKRTSQYNGFLSKKEITPTALNTLKKGIKKAKAQNLIGGARLQSTSDFRFEYLLDYITYFQELQAIGSKAQMYTKVPEAVPMFASTNAEVNLSLMARGRGYVECRQGDAGAIDMGNGRYIKLVFSSVTGMNEEDAFRLQSMYNNVQTIMVGINDDHILACMKDDRIAFIIPYHASGSTENRYLSMMKSVNESVLPDARQDYSKVQNDTELKLEELIKAGDTEEVAKQKIARREMREKILTSDEKATFTEEEMDIIHSSKFLTDLYERFYVDENSDCYGVKLTKGQAEKIMPFEYWDTSSTRATADINGQLFVDYCAEMGIKPRFEELYKLSENKGYWKTLIDRSMYNNDGTYHVQKAVTMEKFNTDFVKINEETRKPMMVEGVVQPDGSLYKYNNPSKYINRNLTSELVREVKDRIENKRYSVIEEDNVSNEVKEYLSSSVGDRVNPNDPNSPHMIWYHGSPNASFTVFNDTNSTTYDEDINQNGAIYLTSSKPIASSYSGGNKVVDAYNLNKTNLRTINKQFKDNGSNAKIQKRSDGMYIVGESENDIMKAVMLHSDMDTWYDMQDYIEETENGFEAYVGEDLEEVINNLNITGNTNAGIYELYAKSENPFVINANGANWNEIRIPAEMYNDLTDWYSDDDYVSTRDIENWVKEYTDYDSIRISNVVDNGGKGSAHNKSEVLVVFDSNKVKAINNQNPTSNPDIRYSLEEDYMDAVKNNDTESMQRMVEEEARRKGYDSPMLFHGTQSFGFTEFDLGKSDDNMSIFTTDLKDLASTYSGQYNKDRISEANVDINNMSLEEQLEYINKKEAEKEYDGRNYRIPTDADFRKVIDKFNSNINKEVEKRKESLGMLKGFGENFKTTFGDMGNGNNIGKIYDLYVESYETLRKMAETESADEYERLLNDYREIGYNIYKYDNNRSDKLDAVYAQFVSKQLVDPDSNIEGKYSMLRQLVKGSNSDYLFYDKTKWNGDIEADYIYKGAVISRYDNGDAGVYSLYGKTSNMMEVDAHDAEWDSIRYKGEFLRTRDLAKIAKDSGKDGLIIRNVMDNGGYDYYVEEPTDLYIYFNPSSLKSADPVTYDNNGNVIPLSERFNDSNNDIRYSLDEDNLKNELVGLGFVNEGLIGKDINRGIKQLNAEFKNGGNFNENTVNQLREDAYKATFEDVGYPYAHTANELYKRLRGLKLNRNSLRGDFGGAKEENEFVKKNFGLFRFGKDGMTIDRFYNDLASEYNDVLSGEAKTAREQLEEIKDAYQLMKDAENNRYQDVNGGDFEDIFNEGFDRAIANHKKYLNDKYGDVVSMDDAYYNTFNPEYIDNELNASESDFGKNVKPINSFIKDTNFIDFSNFNNNGNSRNRMRSTLDRMSERYPEIFSERLVERAKNGSDLDAFNALKDARETLSVLNNISTKDNEVNRKTIEDDSILQKFGNDGMNKKWKSMVEDTWNFYPQFNAEQVSKVFDMVYDDRQFTDGAKKYLRNALSKKKNFNKAQNRVLNDIVDGVISDIKMQLNGFYDADLAGTEGKMGELWESEEYFKAYERTMATNPIESNVDKVAEAREDLQDTVLGRMYQAEVNNTAGGVISDDYVDAMMETLVKDGKLGEVPAKVVEASEPYEDKKTARKRGFERLYTKLIDHDAPIMRLADRTNNPHLKALTKMAHLFRSVANQVIMNKRIDFDGTNNYKVIGKGLNEIWEAPIKAGYENEFSEYLYHYRNIDSMTLQERYGDAYVNKPVFGRTVTAEESREEIARYEQQHPEFKEWAKEIYDYLNIERELAVKEGFWSEEFKQKLEEMYPHYVPIKRDGVNSTIDEGNRTTSSNKFLKSAKGSSKNMLSAYEAMAGKTTAFYRSVLENRRNIAISQAIDPALKITENGEINFDEDEWANFEAVATDGDMNAKMVFFINGVKCEQSIQEDIYDALSPRQRYEVEDNALAKGVQKFSKIRRNLITGWNPIFSITNGFKDFGDAVFNTKHGFGFYADYLKAVAEVRKNGDYLKLYQAYGGGDAQFTNDQDTSGLGVMKKAVDKIKGLNDTVEMLPRLAEFIGTLDRGGTVEQAILDSADITTDFSRGGDLTKAVDRNGFTFLNASVQGMDKQVRKFNDARKDGAVGLIKYFTKLSVLYGIPLIVMNGLIWKDDDDYDALSDYIKKNYYIVGKYGDGKFLRIPKGRISVAVQNAMTNAYDTVTQQTNAFDAMVDTIVTAYDSVGVANPLANNILAPAYQTIKGETWYGDDLIPSRLEKVRKGDQYDESTDAISIALGQLSKKVADATGSSVFELSPIKLNYLADQYTGVLGDFGLPMITVKASNGINNNFLSGLANPILDKFTTDAVLKNQNVTDFYTLKDELTAKKNDSDEAKLASKFANKVASEMSDLYKAKREIQLDKTIGNKEKYDAVREIQKDINALAVKGLMGYDNVDIIGNSAVIDNTVYKKDEDGDWTKVASNAGVNKLFGLYDEQNADNFEKANAVYSITSLKDDNGKTISNSRALQVRQELMNQGMYEAVMKKIDSGEAKPDDFHLSKTVVGYSDDEFARKYAEIIGGEKTTVATSKKKKSSGSSSKTTKSKAKTYKVTAGADKTITNSQAVKNNDGWSYNDAFTKAYSSVFGNRGQKTTSQGGSSITCPNCGASVNPIYGRCPNCGAEL